MSLVLIIEDNHRNLKLLRDLLQSKGHQTLEAETGTAGFQIAKTSQPDLVLLDIRLPDQDGISVFNTLKGDPTTSSIPVIAISASVMPLEKTLVIATGFDDFIEKPINIKRFLDSVDRVLLPRRN